MAAGLVPARRGLAAAKLLQPGPNLYESIGVVPLVNCRGTFTIITGSVSLRISQKIQGTSLSYDFRGTVEGDNMKGTVSMATARPNGPRSRSARDSSQYYGLKLQGAV